MSYIVRDQELVLQHWPGKGAWTYHLIIPNSRDIPGTWGHIKVSGTIDDYTVESRNLAPRKNQDKMLSVNAAIRQHLGKQAGDTVRVTLYREPNPVLVREAAVLACLDDAGVLTSFNARNAKDRRALLHEVFSQPDATRQEKKILALIAMLGLQSTTG
ncbi:MULTISPECIES: DUF1905 domain-containing protein [Hymenobacter]|uniref:DUF1905 domain-containing protein n=1 Tax=Hymenobacter wooponensis TaxID=1525360 RepID=A0A4Z0MC24_9BACT|nr:MULTISPECIES: DUF1905 domain-containing protein [Hymenobacter]MCR5890757.1 DUF1905 domain-containing protein [Hymenobacter sp. J193]MCR5890865.1 DUF1905 domain-containing protein [Hymenobacter sp. J193]TGD77016.1 DUF1905 domain-containing protein [Hymenobacter wooponensis]